MAPRVQVVIDCADPSGLAPFWAEVLGYIEQPPPEGSATWEDWAREHDIPEEDWNKASAVVDPEGKGPRFYFQQVPEGKVAKNRVHLDVFVAEGLGLDATRAARSKRRERLDRPLVATKIRYESTSAASSGS